MARFLFRRLAEMVGTLIAASFLVFGAVYLAPGKPESFLMGGHSATPEVTAAIRARYHLDDPFPLRYIKWLGDVCTGDFGQSMGYRTDVRSLIAARLPDTLLLIGMAALLVVVVGIALGWFAAVRGGVADSATLIGTSIGVGTPSFVVGIVLMSVFGVRLGWFPVIGGAPGGFFDTVYRLTLPAIALSFYWIAALAQVTRSAMLEQLGMEHVEVARSRGIPERIVVRRHVFRNALGPILTMSGLTISGLLVTTVLVEAVFSLGGLGSLLEKSVQNKDFAVVQAIALLVVGLFVVINLLVDLIHPLLDPRVTLGRRNSR